VTIIYQKVIYEIVQNMNVVKKIGHLFIKSIVIYFLIYLF